MVNVNELLISNFTKTLIIDASISTLSYYADVYFDKIIIDTQDTYVTTGPSSTPIYTETFVGNNKTISLELSKLVLEDTPVDKTMFFVYFIAKGTPTLDTPCGQDNMTTLKVVVDLKPIYNNAVSLLNDFSKTCQLDKNIIDFVFKLNGLELALKLCNYQLAVKYWNKFFKDLNYTNLLTSNCGCNG